MVDIKKELDANKTVLLLIPSVEYNAEVIKTAKLLEKKSKKLIKK